MEIRELPYLDCQLEDVKYMQKHIPKCSVWLAIIKISNYHTGHNESMTIQTLYYVVCSVTYSYTKFLLHNNLVYLF